MEIQYSSTAEKQLSKLNEGVLKMTIPDKPTSRNQRYVRAENEEKG